MENEHYLTTEDKKHLTSKAVGGTALGFGIAGTALGILNGGLGLFSGMGNPALGKSCSCANPSDAQYLERKQNADYVQITKDYYEGKLANLRELTESFYTLDQKIQMAKDMAAAESRANFDMLNKRIIDLEKESAVQKATQPLYNQINELKMNFINTTAQHGIADTRIMASNLVSDLDTRTKSAIQFEAERRSCADNKIVNYVNSTFYPQRIADITTADTTTVERIYNPLGPSCPCMA